MKLLTLATALLFVAVTSQAQTNITLTLKVVDSSGTNFFMINATSAIHKYVTVVSDGAQWRIIANN